MLSRSRWYAVDTRYVSLSFECFQGQLSVCRLGRYLPEGLHLGSGMGRKTILRREVGAEDMYFMAYHDLKMELAESFTFPLTETGPPSSTPFTTYAANYMTDSNVWYSNDTATAASYRVTTRDRVGYTEGVPTNSSEWTIGWSTEPNDRDTQHEGDTSGGPT